MNSAELAAMFDLRVFPQLLLEYMKPTPHTIEIIRADWDAQCKAFADKIGRPYADVHYPFLLSLDNCKKHPWLRRLMLQPRLSNEERASLNAQRDAAVEAELDRQGDADWRVEGGQRVWEVMQSYAPGAATPQQAWQHLPEHLQQNLCELQAAYRARDRHQRRCDLYMQIHADGLTWVQRWWRQRAFELPWLRLI